MAVSPSMTSLPRARRFDWNNLGVRAASAAVLAPAALFLTWIDPRPFLVLVSVAVSVISIEWGVMTARQGPVRVAAVVTIATLTVTFLAYTDHILPAWACVAVGALAAAAVARGVSARAVDAAYGVLYIAPACLTLVWLRGTAQGEWWTVMLFATTWAADIFAFLVGSALKGPKLWPRYSPNKTWSGLFGGLAGAVGASAAVAAGNSAFAGAAAKMHVSLAAACVIGLAGGVATMAGDLWESMLKRRFGVKDSGDLIPGHGGLLDRVDGLMFATIAFGAARLVAHYGWAR
ncbi:MAG TPA: phosphatidate cytidylyltransferase [Caulobacteraceae bacterium]|nr:phosphatidate cytidylyltransferase [Caulobacteraceae bacterium]